MNKVLDLIKNGQWAEAMEKYKRLNISGKEMGDFLNDQEEPDTLRDIALLGFYSREWKAKDNNET